MSKKNTERPLVSICTPTFNRRPFIATMFQCFRNQNYPRNLMEWIIVDDGTDKIQDLVKTSGIPQIRYFPINKKMNLGAKRNFMHTKATGSILVYMDDDDYYPPDRVSHAVERLMANPQSLCAGSSELYLYFKHIKKMYQCGPYSPTHATAGTFAFRRELLSQTKYEEHAALAEEKAFLKDYTVPFVQLDPMKTILVFSHEHNTFDKRKLLKNQHPQFFKESTKTVDMFIKRDSEHDIKTFFMEDIDGLLLKYEPGEPKMKPDVIEQIKIIEAKHEKMEAEMNEKTQGGLSNIILEQPGQSPKNLTNNEVIELIKQQQSQIQLLTKQNQDYESSLRTVQLQLLEKNKTIFELETKVKSNKKETDLSLSSTPLPTPPPLLFELMSKTTPEVFVSI